jgi:hypothetical protein
MYRLSEREKLQEHYREAVRIGCFFYDEAIEQPSFPDLCGKLSRSLKLEVVSRPEI